MKFKEWLQTRKAGDNPRGDFIRDAKDDRALPDVKTIGQLKNHMFARGACEEAYRQAEIVWREYQKAVDSLPSRE